MSFSRPFTFSSSIQKHRVQRFLLKLTIAQFAGDNISALVFFGPLATQSFHVLVPFSEIILASIYSPFRYVLSIATLRTHLNMYKWWAIYTVPDLFFKFKIFFTLSKILQLCKLCLCLLFLCSGVRFCYQCLDVYIISIFYRTNEII